LAGLSQFEVIKFIISFAPDKRVGDRLFNIIFTIGY
jgi:hypothetical protein